MKNKYIRVIRDMTVVLVGTTSILHVPVSFAQDIEYPSAVKTFQQFCLMDGINPADRLTALAGNGAWQEDPLVSVNIPKMGISKTIQQNYSFSNVASASQWSGEIDGHKAWIVLATFEGKSRYKNLCALILDGPHDAMRYGSELRAAFKTFGIGGKSVDLVHYYEFAGKVGADKHSVRGEIFSRSLSRPKPQTTHIYIAY